MSACVWTTCVKYGPPVCVCCGPHGCVYTNCVGLCVIIYCCDFSLQLTGQDVMDTCFERQICMIAFLPHILDSMAVGRNSYIQTLLKVAERYKSRSFGYKQSTFPSPASYLTLFAGGCGWRVVRIKAWSRTWTWEDLDTR